MGCMLWEMVWQRFPVERWRRFWKALPPTLKAVGLGALVTAVIQSSSATTVMVVGFVNSGIMKLSQAVGVIMGANIGTTVTSWILSLSGIESDNFLFSCLSLHLFRRFWP